MELNTPHEYAQHLKIHHPKKIFSEPQSETALEPAPLEQPVVADNSSYGLEKTGAAALQDNNEEHCEDTDVIEANIGKEIGDEEMLESIFNADVSEQKGILDDSHEHEDEVCNKNKDVEHSSMPILTAGEEKLKAERTKSVDSLNNEDLLNAIQKCDDQNFIQNAMHDGNDVQIGAGKFIHYYAPDKLPTMAKHVIFVIDISGSMRNRKLEQTKDALFTILKDMKEKNIGKPHMIFFQFS